MKINIATAHRTKYIIDKYNLFAKKNYGQNFLINPVIIENIVNLSNITKDDIVIEIGPGIGALTEALVQTFWVEATFIVWAKVTELIETSSIVVSTTSLSSSFAEDL